MYYFYDIKVFLKTNIAILNFVYHLRKYIYNYLIDGTTVEM